MCFFHRRGHHEQAPGRRVRGVAQCRGRPANCHVVDYSVRDSQRPASRLLVRFGGCFFCLCASFLFVSLRFRHRAPCLIVDFAQGLQHGPDADRFIREAGRRVPAHLRAADQRLDQLLD